MVRRYEPATNDADDAFWERMNRVDSDADLPSMAISASHPHDMPYVELLVATPAGKPVFHFQHGHIPDRFMRHAEPEQKPEPMPSTFPARLLRGWSQSLRSVTPSKRPRRRVSREDSLDSTDEPIEFVRPPAQTLSLCAASVAFAAVAPDVQTITTRAGTIFLAATHSLHVSVASAEPTFPRAALASLARLTIAFLSASLSAGIVVTLSERPHFDLTPHMAPFRAPLSALLRHALAHPLPYACLTPTVLPSTIAQPLRAHMARGVRATLRRSDPLVSHALLLTASPPFPRRIILSAAPASAKLTELDLFVLSTLLPEDFKEVKAAANGIQDILPRRVFLQCTRHTQAYALHAVHCQLRLQAEDFEMFEAAVGGDKWRPEWNAHGGGSVWILVLARVPDRAPERARLAARECASSLARTLDTSRGVPDILVAMERPLDVCTVAAAAATADVTEARMRSVLLGVVVFSADRVVTTIGASDHELGYSIVRALYSEKRTALPTDSSTNDADPQITATSIPAATAPASNAKQAALWYVDLADARHRVVGNAQFCIAVCRADKSLAEARALFLDALLPWALEQQNALLPESDRVTVPPRTLLGDFLAPFPS